MWPSPAHSMLAPSPSARDRSLPVTWFQTMAISGFLLRPALLPQGHRKVDVRGTLLLLPEAEAGSDASIQIKCLHPRLPLTGSWCHDPKNLYRNIPCQKVGRGISTKKSLKTFLPKPLWRWFLYQNLSEEKSMPINSSRTSTKKVLGETFLPKTLWREISTRQFSKESPTKKFEETIYQKSFEKNL